MLMRWRLPSGLLLGLVTGLVFLVVIGFDSHRGGLRMPAGKAHLAPAPVEPSQVAAHADNFTETKALTRGHYHVHSQRVDKDALGGFGKSTNEAHLVRQPRQAALYLLAEPDVVLPLGKASGMRLQLVNGTDNELSFGASDSLLHIVQQAKDTDGHWREIEYFPQSWCGNSYHTVYLKPDHAWQFAVPRYRGPQPATLRFALQLDDGTTLYSNEFAGSIHPEQFSVKVERRAEGIMDPYVD
jgi:hypothetical protein